jgi:hypothetical protein
VGASWKSLDLFFDFAIFFLIFLIQLDTVVEDVDQLIWITIPNGHLKSFFIRTSIFVGLVFILRIRSFLLLWEGTSEDVIFTIGDHLVGNFAEQVGHGGGAGVISGDGVDHLDSVHQGWEGFDDGFWSSFVKWLNELFKDSQVLDIILGLI